MSFEMKFFLNREDLMSNTLIFNNYLNELLFHSPRRKRTVTNCLTSILHFHCYTINTAQKINWKPSSGRSQENDCYRRPIYKQFVQISGLCGPQFLSYNVHVFAEMFHIIIETPPYWWTVLVHQ